MRRFHKSLKPPLLSPRWRSAGRQSGGVHTQHTRTTQHCPKTRHTRTHQRTQGSRLPSLERLSPKCIRPRIVFFSDDWGRHASSSQYLARELLHEFEIDWIHTIGSRMPGLSPADLRRSFGRLSEWVRGRESADRMAALPVGLRIHAPIMLPSFRSVVARRLNKSLLDRGLRHVLRRHPAPSAVVTTTPLMADLAKRYRHLRWVYYCPDAYDHWPGIDGATFAAMEGDLLRVVDDVIACSRVIYERLERVGHEPHLITHGVDVKVWRTTRENTSALLPRALFWGIADQRLDVKVCLALAETCDLTLIGPHDAAPDPLRAHPRIRWESAVEVKELPRRARNADVLVMPYRICPATQAMQPLKLKEYLATGLPIVSTPLPAVLEWSDALDIAANSEDFAHCVLERAGRPLPSAQVSARERLTEESWRCKAAAFRAVFMTSRTPTVVLDVRCTSGAGGGPEKTILSSSRYLRRRGYESLAAILHDPEDPGFESLQALGLREGCRVLSVPDHGPLDLSLVRRCVELCRHEGVHVWHGHDYKSNLLGLLVRRHFGLHLVTTAHGWVHHTVRTPLYFAIDRWCLRRYDCVIAVSNQLGAECAASGVSPERLHVVENAIEAPPPVPRRSLDSPRIRIGSVGRLAAEKGFLDLFEAFARLVTDGHDVELQVFGEGPQRSELARWIARRGLGDRVLLRGFEADRSSIFRTFDIFVLSSHREGLPNALLEAMAQALPIVATRVGGVPDAVTHGEHALLVPPRAPRELHTALQVLCLDPTLRARLGDAARVRVEAGYAFDARMTKIADLLDQLCGST